jgi:hypothetical protein
MTKLTPAARKARNAKLTARSAFGIGVVVSLSANVYAAPRNAVAIGVALWVPIAFLISMALLENVPAHGLMGKVRFGGVAALALIAGWASYWHMVTVANAAGADWLTAHLLPLTVDVMMALAGSAMKAKPAAPARKRPAAKKAATSNVRPIRKAV